MRGNKILERLTVQDSNTPHSCDYRYIAAGLFWSAFAIDNSLQLRLFFLICVAIAGIFGAMTLPNKDSTEAKNLTTLYIQTLPAIIAIALVWKT